MSAQHVTPGPVGAEEVCSGRRRREQASKPGRSPSWPTQSEVGGHRPLWGDPVAAFPLVRGWSRLLETQSWMWPAAWFHRRGGVGTGAGRARACEAGAIRGSQATAKAPEAQGAGPGGSGNPNPGGGTPLTHRSVLSLCPRPSKDSAAAGQSARPSADSRVPSAGPESHPRRAPCTGQEEMEEGGGLRGKGPGRGARRRGGDGGGQQGAPSRRPSLPSLRPGPPSGQGCHGPAPRACGAAGFGFAPGDAMSNVRN